MNSNKTKLFLLFLVGALAGMFAMYIFSNYKIAKKQNETPYVTTKDEPVSTRTATADKTSSSASEIDDLTDENVVVDYVKKNGELPYYYITKSDARRQGWNPSQGNLCEVLPGRAIGGDKFSNREKQLPKGEQYYEADVNYNCGNRNADRIVFTKNGEVWLTHDHYRSFEKQ